MAIFDPSQPPARVVDPIEGLGDLTAILRLAEVRERGLGRETLRANGILSCEAAAAGLRARGCVIEVFKGTKAGDERMRLLEGPGAGAKRRKAAQTTLVDPEAT